MYGLKQAPWAWFEKLKTLLYCFGFQNSQADTWFFILKTNLAYVLILVYVDGFLIIGNNIQYIAQLIQKLHSIFFLKDLASLNYFLCVEVTQTSSIITLSQLNIFQTYWRKTKMVLGQFLLSWFPTKNCLNMMVIFSSSLLFIGVL